MLASLMQRFTPLEMLLIFILCIAIPTLRLTRHLWGMRLKINETIPRICLGFALLGVPLVLLAIDWPLAGRSAQALGVAVPIPVRGQIGFAIAVILIFALLIRSHRPWRKPDPQKTAAYRARLADAGMLMRTPTELAAFFGLAILQGCGGEILFRGLLLWALVPLLGPAGAVVMAATAASLGQGNRTWARVLVSMLTAYAFCIAYAVTHSLWWLMLFRTFAMSHDAWRGYRPSRNPQTSLEEIALAQRDRL